MRRVASRLVAGLSLRLRWLRPAWPLLAVFGGVILAGVLAITSSAQAQTTYQLKLQPQGTSAAISLSATTCSGAAAKLAQQATGVRFTLGVAPTHFPSLDVTTVALSTDTSSSCKTLVLRGQSTVLGEAVTVLVVGTWASPTATTPTFTVTFGFGAVGLGQLLAPSSGAVVGATFSHAWLSATTASGGSTLTVTANATTAAGTAINQFLSGYQGTALQVPGSGVGFAGELASTGDLASGLGKLGVSGVQLTGSLVGSVSNFSASAPPTPSAGFSVTASFGLAVPALPSWLSLPQGNAFTLTISGNSSGTWSVAADGKATVTIASGTVPTPVTADFSLSKSGVSTPVTVGLHAQLGKVPSAFGVSWLTLTTTALTWTVSASTLTGSLHAKVSFGTAPTAVALSATVTLSSGNGASADLSLATSSTTLSTSHLASVLGAALPANAPTISLKHLELFLAVPTSGGVTVAAEAGATLAISSTSYPVSMLLRYQSGGPLLVAAKTTSKLTLSDLVSGLPQMANVSMTDLAVLFSTGSVNLQSTSLDPPTKAFFDPLYCTANQTCSYTLKVGSGVTIQAGVGLPTSVKTMVCKLVDPTATPTPTSCIQGPVNLDGHIPLFGTSKTVSLTIALPTLRISSGPVQQLTLGLSVKYASEKFSVTASGDLVLLVPSSNVTGTGNCPAGVTRPSTDVCLTLTVSGALSAGTGGVSVTFSAALTGQWRLPSPVSWLTIDHLAVQVGITANETGPGLTLGVGGTFTVGTDLGFAVHLKAMAEAPWVELLGFKVKSTTGISMQDLAALYHDVSGQTLTPSALPPLALKDLLFEYSATLDPVLRLCPGLHISADLVITNGHWAQGSYTAPTSTTCNATSPTRSTACSANKSSCLASVLLTISTQGFVGEGHLTGWSAGPLKFTPVTLDVTVKSSEVQVHISGGGELLSPTTWPTEKTAAPEWLGGSITLTVGTQRLALTATGDIGSVSATISGNGSLTTLANPGFTLTSWLTTAKHALQTAGNHIKQAMTTVGTTVSGWYSTYVASEGNQVASDIQSAFKFFGSTGPPTWEKVYSVFQKITSAISSWNSGVNSVHMSFLDITANGIFHAALHGISVGGVTVCVIKCVTLVPGFTIPGVCTYVTAVQHTPLCTSGTIVAGARSYYADPTVQAHLTSQNLALPSGASDQSLVTKVHQVDPPGGTTPPISCAMATESYSKGYVSPTTLQVDALGNPVTIQGPTPTTLGTSTNQSSINQELGQNTLNGLYSGQNQGTCTPPSKTPQAPMFSLGLKQSWIYEGQTVTAVVRAGTGITGVSITWGDGTSGAASLTSTHDVYVASHVYADERTSGGATSPFTVTATATVATGVAPVAPDTRRVAVADAPLALSALAVTPSTIDVMQSVTVSGQLANPEPDEAVTATITWGDGTQTPVSVAATGRFSVSHLYNRLTPTGAPQQPEPISVTMSEPDGTAAGSTSSVTVNDVPPTGLVLQPAHGAYVSNHGTVFSHAGVSVGWASHVLDVSPVQRFAFSFTWNDGTPASKATVTSPTPPAPGTQGRYTYPVATTSVAHGFVNACLYTVTTTATDDDTLSTSLSTPVIVTAPLGFQPAPNGYWQEHIAKSIGYDGGKADHGGKSQLTAAQVTCYLEIAQHLSPQLGLVATPAGGLAVLRPRLDHLGQTQKLAARLKEQLLTVLLDFSNGSWDWNQAVSPDGTTLQTVVNDANQALTSQTRSAMVRSLAALGEAMHPDKGAMHPDKAGSAR